MARREFVEDDRGVHACAVGDPLAALCDSRKAIHDGSLSPRPASSRVVTCPACSALVLHCRGLRVEGDEKAAATASERGIKFAEWFASLLPSGTDKGANWRVRWGIVYDHLIETDKRTPEEIVAVCRFARGHSFWCAHFLAPSKLRKRDASGATFFDRWRAALKPVDSARLVQKAGQEAEGKSTAKIVEFQ